MSTLAYCLCTAFIVMAFVSEARDNDKAAIQCLLWAILMKVLTL